MEGKTELERNAVVESRRKALDSYQRALDMKWLNSRMEDGRMGRCIALIQREAEMEKNYQERTDHASIVNATASKEAALAKEIALVRHEEASKLLRRHQLRDQDPSLRELTRKLQAGYVCRDLKLQIQNNEYKRLQDEAEAKHANDVLLNALQNDQEAKQIELKHKMEHTTAYRKDLQQQLLNREKAKQCQFEDSLIEKKMLEEVMRTIADEDHKELEQKRSNTERLRNEMITFKQARDEWKRKQKLLCVKQEREIEKQKAMADSRTSSIAEERARKLRIKEELNEKIVTKILDDQAARQERENIIIMLKEQEYLEQNMNEQKAEKDKLMKTKRDTMDTLTRQMNERMKLEREQKIRDAELRKQTEQKLLLEKKKEREQQMKEKEKQKQYAADLKQQIERDRNKREKEKQMDNDRATYVWNCDKAWREEVSNERKEIIKEHVPPLLGYLQAGVINKSDLPSVKEGVNLRGEEFKNIDVNKLLGNSNKTKVLPKCNAQCRVLREY